jgi:hypothetical protein
MEKYQSISRFDIDDKLSVEQLRISRTICFAMVAGVLIFLLLILFLYYTQEINNDLRINESYVFILKNIMPIIALIIYSVFLLFPGFFLKPENIRKRLAQVMYDQNRKKIDDPVEKLIIFDRLYMVLRMAMLEGVSLFGMVVLLQAVTNAYIKDNPILWLWILPFFILAVFGFKNYLHKDSYIERIENQILVKLNRF